MKNKIKKLDFITWCKFMFDENTQERWDHGQQPYKDFNTYFSKNEDWLQNQYERDIDREVFNLL